MKPKVAFAILTLPSLPLIAGDSAVVDPWSAKGGLAPHGPSTSDPLAPSPEASKAVIIPPHPDSRWVLGAGFNLRQIGRIDFDTGASGLTIPVRYTPSFTPVPGVGPETGFADRIYNDPVLGGFLRPNVATPNTGRTSDYGYLSPSQVDGNTLVYSALGGERIDVQRDTSASPGHWTDGRDWELSPYFKISHLTPLRSGWSVGPTFHLSFTNVEGAQGGHQTLFGREQRDTFDLFVTDRYDITDLTLFEAPYTGSPAAIGPQVPANPSRTPAETLRATDVARWNDDIRESLDVDLWSISIGGEAVFQASDRLFFAADGGVIMQMADWEATRRDTLYQRVNDGTARRISSTESRNGNLELLFGIYLQGKVGYQVTPALSVVANLRYDWSQPIDDRVGNSTFEVDLSGLSVGLGAHYSFW